MKHSIKTLISGLIISLFLASFPVSAQKWEDRPNGLDERGPLTKITFIHYKKGAAKPSGVGKSKGEACYTFLSKGAKWKDDENFEINPTNSSLNDGFVKEAMDSGVAEWEKYGGTAIFGNSSINTSAIYNDSIYDGRNVAAFGDYSPGVIAVTTVWGYFYGPPQTRELIEWDMLFNTYYQWGDATVDHSLMDLQNIATHELGHSAGLGDLYNTSCGEETMYGYSTWGETEKRDLNAGDIAGIKKLYQ